MAAGGPTPRSSPGPPARGGKWHVVTSQIAFEVTFTDDLPNGPCTQQSLYGYEVLIGQHNNKTLMDVKAVLEASYEKVPVWFIELRDVPRPLLGILRWRQTLPDGIVPTHMAVRVGRR